MNYLKDLDFLKQLDLDNNKFFSVKINILDKDEKPIQSIEGRTSSGSINIDGSSSVRRTCNLTLIADEQENSLTEINSLFSANKKVEIEIGFENNISSDYDDIIWFKLGIYIVTNPSISHTTGGISISLSLKDKMCLLNGDCGGGLPTSITFHEYDQQIGYSKLDDFPQIPKEYIIYEIDNKFYEWSITKGWIEREDNSAVGTIVTKKQKIYDIIQTLVCNYGNQPISKILINDLPLELKQIVRYTGTKPLYYNNKTNVYTLNSSLIQSNPDDWREFNYNEDVGYIYTDFVYPDELISNIGDSVTSVLDKICTTLGNYEYFFDLNGNFVFQEIKNYLNNSYSNLDVYRLDNYGKEISVNNQIKYLSLADNDLSILNNLIYKVDFNNNSKTVYDFTANENLITSISNAPNYINIKNDYHIWGKNEDGYAIHYHLAIKNKPTVMNTYKVIFLLDDNGDYNGKLRLAIQDNGEIGEDYIPEDWRAELYLQGLQKQYLHQRPDVYEQELLDLFDGIYNFKEKKFKGDIVHSPNELSYFLDYIEPNSSDLINDSIDALGQRVLSVQQDKIIKLFNCEIPNIIILNIAAAPEERASDIRRCELEGCYYSNVDDTLYSKLAIGTVGYTAQEKARELLYQHTNYTESISIQSIPIYYLDVNTRISVDDLISNIKGDYIIKTISLPLDAKSTMSITATRALERI